MENRMRLVDVLDYIGGEQKIVVQSFDANDEEQKPNELYKGVAGGYPYRLFDLLTHEVFSISAINAEYSFHDPFIVLTVK